MIFRSCPQCEELFEWADETGGLILQQVNCPNCKSEFEVIHKCSEPSCTSWLEPLTNKTRMGLVKQADRWKRNQAK